MKSKSTHDLTDGAMKIALRPELPEDESFLADVYASTRQDELNLTNWDAATRSAFLAMQFKAMRQGYRSSYPNAQFSIILVNGSSVGRMVVDRGQEEIRLVDIALLPPHCGRAIGTKIMQGLMAEAVSTQKPVRLCVFHGTRAIQFYRRLGFIFVGQAGIYQDMEWQPRS